MTCSPIPVTLPLSGYKAQHVRLAVEGKVATLTLEPAGQEEPADLRELRRDRRASSAPPPRTSR